MSQTTETASQPPPSSAGALGGTLQPSRKPIVIQPRAVQRFFWLLQRACMAAADDGCFSIAKGAAYSFLLSLFPVLTTLTGLLIQARAQKIVHILATFVTEVAPPGTEDMMLQRLRLQGRPVSLSIFAALLALWAGAGAMLSLMEGFQAAYRIPSGRPFLKQRAMAIFLVLIAAVPAIVASTLLILGERGEVAFVQWLGFSATIGPLGEPLQLAWHLGRYVLAFVTTTFVTGLLYYFGANHRIELGPTTTFIDGRFMRVWPGALVATTLWLITTVGFAWYVRHLAHYSIFYGSIWAVIVLLIWLYLIACIALIGCEFNAECERLNTGS